MRASEWSWSARMSVLMWRDTGELSARAHTEERPEGAVQAPLQAPGLMATSLQASVWWISEGADNAFPLSKDPPSRQCTVTALVVHNRWRAGMGAQLEPLPLPTLEDSMPRVQNPGTV